MSKRKPEDIYLTVAGLRLRGVFAPAVGQTVSHTPRGGRRRTYRIAEIAKDGEATEPVFRCAPLADA